MEKHGHELKGENVGGRGCAGCRGIKRGKWDKCNSIINKIYLKKEIYCSTVLETRIKSKIKVLQDHSLSEGSWGGIFYFLF